MATSAILGIGAVVVLAVNGIHYIENDPKAMKEVQEVRQEVADLSSEIEEQQRKRLEYLEEENRIRERNRQEQLERQGEQRRPYPEDEYSKPWPQDPYPKYPPPGYYERRR